MNSVVVHFKELALKGRNRPWFVQHLVRNLRVALKGLDVGKVRSVMGRIEIELADASWDEARERIRHVFGIANFSKAGRGSLDFGELAGAILEDLGDRESRRFASASAARTNGFRSPRRRSSARSAG